MMSESRWRLGLSTILGVGALLRLVVFLGSRDWIVFRLPVLDAGFYHQSAVDLIAGSWPGAEPYFMGPLYTYVVASFYALLGADPIVVRVAQMLLGLVGIWLTARVGRSVFGPSAGLVSAGLMVVYGPFVFYEQLTLMTTFLVVGALALLDRALALRDGGGWITAAALGLVAGALCGFRLASLVYLVPIGLLLGFGAIRTARAWAAVAILVVMLLPFTVHNVKSGSRALLTTNLGWNLYIGNGENAAGMFAYPNAWEAESDPTGRNFASRLSGRRLSADETNRFWIDRTLAENRDAPGRVATLLARKLAFVVQSEEIPQNESFRFFRVNVPTARVASVGWWFVFPVGILGVFARCHTRRLKLATVGFALVPIVICMAFFVTSRYRLPAVPFLIVLAGGAIGGLFDSRVRAARSYRIGAMLAAATAVLLLVLPAPLDVSRAMAREYEHVGLRYQMEGAYRAAEEQYQRALRLNPDDGDTHNNLGTALIELGRPTDAEVAFQEAIRCQPRNPIPMTNLARLLGEMGRDAEAEAVLRRALPLDPTSITILMNLGTSLARQGRFDEAIEAYQTALDLDPADTTVRELLFRAKEVRDALRQEAATSGSGG